MCRLEKDWAGVKLFPKHTDLMFGVASATCCTSGFFYRHLPDAQLIVPPLTPQALPEYLDSAAAPAMLKTSSSRHWFDLLVDHIHHMASELRPSSVVVSADPDLGLMVEGYHSQVKPWYPSVLAIVHFRATVPTISPPPATPPARRQPCTTGGGPVMGWCMGGLAGGLWGGEGRALCRLAEGLCRPSRFGPPQMACQSLCGRCIWSPNRFCNRQQPLWSGQIGCPGPTRGGIVLGLSGQGENQKYGVLWAFGPSLQKLCYL